MINTHIAMSMTMMQYSNRYQIGYINWEIPTKSRYVLSSAISVIGPNRQIMLQRLTQTYSLILPTPDYYINVFLDIMSMILFGCACARVSEHMHMLLIIGTDKIHIVAKSSQ